LRDAMRTLGSEAQRAPQKAAKQTPQKK
jgi:hypothetical protein